MTLRLTPRSAPPRRDAPSACVPPGRGSGLAADTEEHGKARVRGNRTSAIARSAKQVGRPTRKNTEKRECGGTEFPRLSASREAGFRVRWREETRRVAVGGIAPHDEVVARRQARRRQAAARRLFAAPASVVARKRTIVYWSRINCSRLLRSFGLSAQRSIVTLGYDAKFTSRPRRIFVSRR